MGFDTVNNKNRIIKIKLFNVCNKMVIIDCKQYPKYKIYNLYNLDIIKSHYKTQKINFDELVEYLCLFPIFIGNINNLEIDYKRISKLNENTCNIINILHVENYLIFVRKIEKKIIITQNELVTIFKNTYFKHT
jgi:hypothetical protein